jgi:uncharacterized protein YbjT (DUF2867 family)
VDRDGTRSLLKAASAAGVSHIIYVSVFGARPGHPMELARMKYAAEQQIRASGLAWTILRPMPFTETWLGVVAGPVKAGHPPVVLGRAANPISFVSVRDVAAWAERALDDHTLRSAVIELAGPQDLGLRQLARVAAADESLAVRRVPRPALRLAGQALRPIRPGVARMIRAAVLMDTIDMTAPSHVARQPTAANEVASVRHKTGHPVRG